MSSRAPVYEEALTMLVVTRKLDESLIISDNIEITVLEIGKDKVKIGINAPKR